MPIVLLSPQMEKDAFTSSQLRTIKRLIKVTREPAEAGATYKQLVAGRIPVGINVPKRTDAPVGALAHELGHMVDMTKRKGLIDSGPSLINEISANRQGARFLLYTGSPVSEVKQIIRGWAKPIRSYVDNSDTEFISEMFTKNRRAFSPADMSALNRIADTNDVSLIRSTAEQLAERNMINLNAIFPFRKIKTPIDLSPAGRNASIMKDKERAAFAEFVKDHNIKKAPRVPRIIYL